MRVQSKVLALALLPLQLPAAAAESALEPLRVHAEGHYLETSSGRPFFWLGDTSWELIHGTTRQECSYYLNTRSLQGFNVIQANVLGELDGLNRPTPDGLRPFVDNDPEQPVEAYFDRVVEITDEAAALGLYMALLPAWGDKLTAPWGDGPRIFTMDNLPVARAYALYLGKKLKGRTNVVWMLGGDRPALLDEQHKFEDGFPAGTDFRPIWREMAAGLTDATGSPPVILYHPQSDNYSTSVTLPDEAWLSVHGMQSGHGGGRDQPVWEWIARDYALTPAKPTLDLEPNYEDHPYNPWPRWDPASGYFRDHDVRKQCYRSVLAGGCGVTYGHHSVWSLAGGRNPLINHPDRDWISALHRPAAQQMLHLRQLIESRPYFNRIPDPSMVSSPAIDAAQHLVASRDKNGSYAFVYYPSNDQTATIDLGKLGPGKLNVWWFDPRIGFAHPREAVDGGSPRSFTSPSYGPDWVLVLDTVASGYPAPGMPVRK